MDLRYESVRIAEILLNRIKAYHLTKKDTDLLITYGNLSKQLDMGIRPRNLDRPLGDLSDYCIEACNLPRLSALVVNQSDYMPGDGFFTYFYAGSPHEKWESIFIHELNSIKKSRNWHKLAESLHITIL